MSKTKPTWSLKIFYTEFESIHCLNLNILPQKEKESLHKRLGSRVK